MDMPAWMQGVRRAQRFDCHSRACGNGLFKPLDSSFRWNDGEVLFITCVVIIWARSPVCGERARCPGPPGEGWNPPPSFRRRPESSGLFNPFPHSGNALRAPESVYHPASAFLDSGFRRNDEGAIDADWQPHNLNPPTPVIHGHACMDAGRSASSAVRLILLKTEPW